MNDTTTIQIPKKLKTELDSIKDYKRETYAELIRKLIERFKEDEESELELSEDTLKAVEEGREDVRKGRVYSIKQAEKELGL